MLAADAIEENEAELARVHTVKDNYCALLFEANAELARLRAGQEPVAIANKGECAFWVSWTEAGKSLRGPGIKLYTAPQPSAVPDAITMADVQRAYDYATEHPHKYLRGTTNWCAAVAHSLNQRAPSAPATVQGDVDGVRAVLARSASPVKRAIDLLQNYRALISARSYPDNDEGDAMERRDYIEEKHAELCVYGLREVLVSAIAAAQEGGKV